VANCRVEFIRPDTTNSANEFAPTVLNLTALGGQATGRLRLFNASKPMKPVGKKETAPGKGTADTLPTIQGHLLVLPGGAGTNIGIGWIEYISGTERERSDSVVCMEAANASDLIAENFAVTKPKKVQSESTSLRAVALLG
jgi:hypothetical protein